MTDDTFGWLAPFSFLSREKEGDKAQHIRFVTALFTAGDGLPLRIHKPSSLLPTESFLSDPSDGLIADDFQFVVLSR